jgi:RecJ-like exonuclease
MAMNQTDDVAVNPGDDAASGTPGTGENICPVCNGKGKTDDDLICPNCGGSGKIVEGIGGG